MCMSCDRTHMVSTCIYAHSQHVYELCHRVSLLHDDLLGPVNEGSVGVLHPDGYHRSKDVQGLADNTSSLDSMSLQQAKAKEILVYVREGHHCGGEGGTF